ncbi:MAG: ketoacyl-ACP synthase III [Endomicrobia bacterium]|nr:ketoacyl-ACP synthase III [Endomicrobiia bacterium]MCX7941460.1 ketoacyl-ACP synthase III [Endomicrobiia bacterium]MDW8055436.1 beta-ketoacyl-ACP synthase III [Elusimicrobiota bacterium]
MNKKVKILSTGHYVPPKVLTNFDLEKMVDTSDEWITTRTGIKERRIVEPNISSSDIAAEAARNCLNKVNIDINEIDTIIVATITPDMFFPSTACIVHKKLGGKNEPAAFDISAACSGFIYGLTLAEGLIRNGKSKNLLLIAADVLSKFTNWKDRNTCVLFGDGAGAMLLSATDDEEDAILSTYLGADGNYDELLYIPAGGSKMPATIETVEKSLHTIFMSGKEVFKVAVTKMVEAANKACELAGITTGQIDLLIPHQANLRIITAVGDRLGIPQDKVFVNVDKYGNMSAATVIVGLDQAISNGRVKKGSIVELVAFGGGFTWGATVIKL